MMVFLCGDMSDTFEKAWATVKGSPVPLFAQNPGRYRNPRNRQAGSGSYFGNEGDGEFGTGDSRVGRELSPEEGRDLAGMAQRATSEDRKEAREELGPRPLFGGKKWDKKDRKITMMRAPSKYDMRAERMPHGTGTGSQMAENPMDEANNPFFKPNND